MTTSALLIGTQIALEVHDSSANGTCAALAPTTLRDLLDILAQKPPRALPMLRATSSLLAAYLDKTVEQISLDSVNDTRDGFRPYLEGRKYKENSVRTYVNHTKILLSSARDFGWTPTRTVPEEWRGVLELATEKECDDLAKHLANVRKTPREVTTEDVDQWVTQRVQTGLTFDWARTKETRLWRILRDCGYALKLPVRLLRQQNFGVPLDQMPPALKREVLELLNWKKVEFSVGRPKGGRHREVSSRSLKNLICAIYGFAINVRGGSQITSLPELIQKSIVSGYMEWSVNVRKVKAYGLQSSLGLVLAAMHQHPSYSSVDLSWFKPLLDSLPAEPRSEMQKRKASKCLEYNVVESIPAKIRAERPRAAKKGDHHIAMCVMEELLMKWLYALPWRQKNIRQCRISGPEPNLFKGKIQPFCGIDKPEWVQLEEQRNPDAEFWQFRFSCDETKMHHSVDAVLPRPLIGLLEEYLRDFRPHLIRKVDPGTLFVSSVGKQMRMNRMNSVVSTLTLRHGGRRVTPHHFRDIVAFKWLKEHPRDFLTLSKILWHTNIQTTIKIYGSQFNESSGVCAMESWLEEREAKSK